MGRKRVAILVLVVLVRSSAALLGAVGAEQPSAELLMGQMAQARKGDPEVQMQINEAFSVFEDLLSVTRGAAAPHAEWRVELESWRDAQAAWEKALATLPAPVQHLKRCWLPLQRARSLIEQSQQLFLQAEDGSDPRAVDLLLEHHELHKKAQGPLKQAEKCYRAVRKDYLP